MTASRRSSMPTLSASWALLQAVPVPYGPGEATAFATSAQLPGDLPGAIAVIINVVLTIVAVLALSFVVYGGFRYMSARGDERELETAKQIITGAIIAIVVIGLAAAIVAFVFSAIPGAPLVPTS